MSEQAIGQMIQALYREPVLADWERDFVAAAYAHSAAGSKPFQLTQKQVENVQSIFARVYQ